jgi:two-component system, cell cycle sensor histidine kinase and response regulator CckA
VLTKRVYSLFGVIEGDFVIKMISSEQNQPKGTILVVDDNELFRNLILTILRRSGYTVYEASGSKEALQKVQELNGAIDLMITDVVMPDISGSDLYKEVYGQYPHIKVLFVSGYAGDVLIHSDVEEIIESKKAFLQKPFPGEDLLKMVEKELDQRKC